MPRLQCPAEGEPDAVVDDAAEGGEAELEPGVEPRAFEGEAGPGEIGEDVEEVLPDERGEEEPVVEGRAPADEPPLPRFAPQPRHQRPHHQLHHQAHPHLRGHLEGAQFHQAAAPGGGVGGMELVDAELRAVRVAGEIDEEIAEQPVDEPRGRPATRRAAGSAHLVDGDLQLVEALVPRLVDPRGLAGGSDESAREQVREGGMVVPVGDQARQQVGPAEERALGDGRAAEHQVVAATGADVPAVEFELLRHEPAGPRLLVERCAKGDQLAPRPDRGHVDLDHAGIGGDGEPPEQRPVGRWVALEHHRAPHRHGDLLHLPHQLQPVADRHVVVRPLRLGQRRQEEVHPPATHLDDQCRAHDSSARGRRPLFGPGEERHGQAQPGGRVTRHQFHPAPHRPITRPPAHHAATAEARQRKDGGDRRGGRRPRPRLVRRQHRGGIDTQRRGQPAENSDRVGGRGRTGQWAVIRQEIAAGPHRLPVGPPHHLQRPPRQRLAGVPLPLRLQEHPAASQPVEEPPRQGSGLRPLLGAQRRGVPLRTVEIVCRHVGRLPAGGEPYAPGLEGGIDGPPEGVDPLPGTVGEGARRPRGFGHARHAHREREVGATGLHEPGHRRGTHRIGSGRQGNVPLGGEQSAGGVEAHPPGARQEHLRPGMEVGEILVGTDRSRERLLVGSELHEVAGAEAGRETELARQRHQQPRRVAATPPGARERFLRGLHPRLHAHGVFDRLLDRPVEGHEHVDRPRGPARREAGEEGVDLRAAGGWGEGGRQFRRQPRLVGERIAFHLGLEEEVEGVDRHQVGHEIDGQHQLAHRLREHQPGEMVALRILLPVEEMVRGRDGEAVAADPRAAVGGGPQPDHVRGEPHRPVEGVARAVLEGDADRHGGGLPRRRHGPRAGVVAKKVSWIPSLAALSWAWKVSMKRCSPPSAPRISSMWA